MPKQWIKKLAGQFIVFDGPDGCGKSTQQQRFSEFVRENSLEVCTVRDPGGTSIGDQIRNILLDTNNEEMGVCCELMLYMASRAQLVSEQIAPAIKENKLVLSDRFISSTLAYQGAAGGIESDKIIQAGRLAVDSYWPDYVVIFDVDEMTAMQRLTGSTKHHKFIEIDEPTLFSDRMEVKGLDFQRKVRQGFLDQAEADPEHYLVVDASKTEDEVFQQLCLALSKRV